MKQITKAISVLFIGIVSLQYVAFRQVATTEYLEWEIPEMVFPEDNPITDAGIQLGGALFFETLLSKDSTLSCQSCHMVGEAFADHLLVGEGIKGRLVTRNTPTLLNIGYHPYFMADGKFETLEEQVMGPINDHREFDLSASEVVVRLKTIPLYNELSMKAYGKELDIEAVQKSIANYERLLISADSKFDMYQKGDTTLTNEELQGWKLFQSAKLNCIACHSGFNFTNYAFENNGLYNTYSDSGRAIITKLPEDVAKFKVPTLRNISKSFPYMHNGSLSSLEQVIDHYASGGKGHASQSKLIIGFEITDTEKNNLVTFLNTLTGKQFLESY